MCLCDFLFLKSIRHRHKLKLHDTPSLSIHKKIWKCHATPSLTKKQPFSLFSNKKAERSRHRSISETLNKPTQPNAPLVIADQSLKHCYLFDCPQNGIKEENDGS